MNFTKILKKMVACFALLGLCQQANAQAVGTPYMPIDEPFQLNCASAVFSTLAFFDKAEYTGTLTVPYNNGNATAYATQTINSTGVTGLTAVLRAGTLASGNGTLVYDVSGYPAGTGTATFSLNFLGEACAVTAQVYELTYFIDNVTVTNNTKFIRIKNDSPFPSVVNLLISHAPRPFPENSAPFQINGVPMTRRTAAGTIQSFSSEVEYTVPANQTISIAVGFSPNAGAGASLRWTAASGYTVRSVPVSILISSDAPARYVRNSGGTDTITYYMPN